jgi:hypothetical protein
VVLRRQSQQCIWLRSACYGKILQPGGMAERPKAHVLKTCWGHTHVGSNPTPSAINRIGTIYFWGGARVAEWARLLSECRGNSVAGSNPALPAIKRERAGLRRVSHFW